MYRISGWTTAALAAAIALALSAPALADVTASQLPGKGSIVSGQVAAGVASGGAQTITIGSAGASGPANAVINWGSGTDINAAGAAGFNLGSSAQLTFNDGTGGQGAAVLNIDSTGNPSQILGRLTGNGTSLFVANPNGIIVGGTARISSTANVGLIGNTTLSGTGSDFAGGSSIAYTGTGGDVTVLKGALINGTSVLIAGGGNVNVNLSAFNGPSGSTSLSAGMASANAGAGAANNPNASLVTAGALPSGRTLAAFHSAGTALNTGTLVLGDYSVAGLFTNQGKLTVPASNGAVWNQGRLGTSVGTTFSALTNDGTFNTTHSIVVQHGDLINNGTINGAQLINVVDGSVTNSGRIIGVVGLSTSSDRKYQPGAYYSITNTGTITSYGQLTIDANRANHYNGSANTSTGSFINNGILQLAQGAKLQVKGWQDVYLGGKVQTGYGTNAADLSATNPIGELVSSAGGYNATVDTPTFWTDGVLTLATPLFVSGAIVHGRQVKLLSDLNSLTNGAQGGNITIVAGSEMANDYAVSIADGATISAHLISIKGPTYTVAPTDGRVVDPNVRLDGTLTAGWIYLGDAGQPLSSVYSGINGNLRFTGTDPRLTVAFTGYVGAVPTAGTDFRYAYLPARSVRAPLRLSLKPVTYTQAAGSVNLLVNGSVLLVPPSYLNSPAIYGNGSAPSPSTIPNTHLVLQASGNIATGTNSRFYWPGYVYLGTVASNADGTPAPATLGNGTITLGAKFSNVLPGSTASDGGIEFITANPLNLNGYTVTTNANSWVSFGTDALTQQYASGALGAGAFYGGTQSGSQVIYAALDPSMFHTDTPPAAQ